jgi:hypothetical protein
MGARADVASFIGSPPEFPAAGNLAGNFIILADLTDFEPEKSKATQRLAQEIPCAAAQGIS